MAVKRAKSREEMGEPVPKPEKTPEKILWAEKAKYTAEEDDTGGVTEEGGWPIELCSDRCAEE